MRVASKINAVSKAEESAFEAKLSKKAVVILFIIF